MAELTTMLTGFSDELLQTVIDRLQDSGLSDKLEQYEKRLAEAIAKVQQTIASAKSRGMSEEAQASFGNLFDAGGLMRSYSSFSNDMLTEHSQDAFQNAVIALYTLEHEIVDFLTNDKSKTDKYAIYYNVNYDTSIEGCENIKGEFFRGEISPEDIKEFFNVTKNGIIQLKRSSGIIERLQKNFKEDNSGLTKKYQTMGDLWEKLTKAVLGNLMQYFRQWHQDLQNLGETASEDHLGKERWEEYQRLKKLFGIDNRRKVGSNELMQLYRKYMLLWDEQYAGFSMRRMAYNRGHIAEAFERYLVELKKSQSLEPDDESIRRYLNESVGNLPWFAGGDVGRTQVKALFSSDRASVQISSATTLCELGAELANLLRLPDGWIEKAKAKITEKTNSQAKQSQDRFEAVVDNIATVLGNQLAQGIGKNVYTITKAELAKKRAENKRT